MRCEVVFIGRVQGIGFRAAAKSLAAEHHVVGWVRNEADGTVKLVIEGDQDAVTAYLDALRTRLADYIGEEKLITSDEMRGYPGFEIR